ncbi:MAG: HDOD domain-containing protein [Candidatus Krumholzibacteriota bacterium]|nr:HDOD domain-containing protein [Candidatus Krumholzibacteriota bacterium]
MQNISVLINKIDKLPTIPAIIKRLFDLISDPDADLDDIIELIEKDQALTGVIIKLCNSSYYGLSRKVSSISDAVVMLGFNTISNMCITLGPSLYLKRHITIYGQTNTDLWRHSIATATCCEQIAYISDVEMIEVAYTAGLLHDIGKLVLAEYDKNKLKAVHDLVLNGSPLIEAEKKILGMHHGSVGGKLARRWKFPQKLIDTIKYHHTPELANDERELTEIIYLGNLIAKKAIEPETEGADLSQVKGELLEKYKIDEPNIYNIVKSAQKQVENTEASLRALQSVESQ